MMSKPPAVIYLQWDPTGRETTWCEDKINDDDEVYVRMNTMTSRVRKMKNKYNQLKKKFEKLEEDNATRQR